MIIKLKFMKKRIATFFMGTINGCIFGCISFLLYLIKLPDVVIIGFLIGLTQVMNWSDTTDIQNNIHELQKYIKSKYNE